MRETFIALTVLDALLLWVLIRTKGWWAVRGLAILVVLAFNVAIWDAQTGYGGWPTQESPPLDAQLLGCLVEENAGVIYFWLVPPRETTLNPFDQEPSAPRAYRLSYSRDLHLACEGAKRSAEQGNVMVLGRSSTPGRLQFYVLPPQGLPTKEGTP